MRVFYNKRGSTEAHSFETKLVSLEEMQKEGEALFGPGDILVPARLLAAAQEIIKEQAVAGKNAALTGVWYPPQRSRVYHVPPDLAEK